MLFPTFGRRSPPGLAGRSLGCSRAEKASKAPRFDRRSRQDHTGSGHTRGEGKRQSGQSRVKAARGPNRASAAPKQLLTNRVQRGRRRVLSPSRLWNHSIANLSVSSRGDSIPGHGPAPGRHDPTQPEKERSPAHLRDPWPPASGPPAVAPRAPTHSQEAPIRCVRARKPRPRDSQ